MYLVFFAVWNWYMRIGEAEEVTQIFQLAILHCFLILPSEYICDRVF